MSDSLRLIVWIVAGVAIAFAPALVALFNA